MRSHLTDKNGRNSLKMLTSPENQWVDGWIVPEGRNPALKYDGPSAYYGAGVNTGIQECVIPYFRVENHSLTMPDRHFPGLKLPLPQIIGKISSRQ